VVSGEKRFEREDSAGRYRVLQCAYGSFRRVVALPAPVLADKAKASYKNGVLRVELPKAESAKSHRLTIKVA
jgi:HSP20 family protein